ncbi:MAG: bifunctional 5,10-methylenetetrahydrofolate dehydrogenase/5,10-methenyltetrahydrofolate cyclohydrolase [Syntrophomonadaceae bacterium]|nr:bifunctional 5,10-methylenetetrahydrofolate dehydrogenase/5,10-methenyltetrahydrofolate cyclohydrolase [Syntrophomonadaceae bacterium]
MLIYGKEIRARMTVRLKEAFKAHALGLAIVCVGDDPASLAYVRSVMKYGQELGVRCRFVHLAHNVPEDTVINAIDELNGASSIHGIMIHAPLPEGLSAERIIQRISPAKDAEGVQHVNQGRLLERCGVVKPCTPKAVVRILKEHDISLAGRKICVIGRSRIVGAPLSMMLMDEDATVTLCHSRTRNLKQETLAADIIVSATGHIGLVTVDMVRPESIVIDVGTSFDENGKMHGDAHPAVAEKAAILSAVPGGVGSITVPELFDNLLILAGIS